VAVVRTAIASWRGERGTFYFIVMERGTGKKKGGLERGTFYFIDGLARFR
jgi:hypothetical protein